MKTYKEYLVGGAVRDEFLGVKSKDLDYVFVFDNIPDGTSSTECFEEMLNIIKEKGEIFLSTPSCFTIRYKDKTTKEVKDVVLARKEVGYIEGTRTPIIVPGTLYDDLSRRDARLNALARDEDGTIIDYLNGVQDLKDKILRTPLDPIITMNDDPLRLLRMIRFHITKGFTISDPIVEILHSYDYETKMGVVSIERIQQELLKCFKFDTLKTLKVLNEFDRLRDYIFEKSHLWLEPTLKEK